MHKHCFTSDALSNKLFFIENLVDAWKSKPIKQSNVSPFFIHLVLMLLLCSSK